MTVDLTASITPKSDQLNAEDLLSGPVTVTITEVRAGTAEQPVEIHTAEYPGRPFKPSKTVRRILVAAWGPEASAYTGRRMTLFRDATVKWAGAPIGGIRVSHLSHIEKRMSLALTVTRGKREASVVDPLPDVAPAPARTEPAVDLATITDLDALRTMWRAANPGPPRARIEARMAELATS